MKTNNINKFLFINSLIVYAMCIITIFAIIVMYLSFKTHLAESREYIYTIKDSGEIVPMQVIERRGVFESECKHHISTFAEYYYGCNQSNYNNNMQKAVELGDFLDLYKESRRLKLKENIYTYGLEHSVFIDPKNFELTPLNDDKYSFRVLINVDTKLGKTIKHNIIVTSGTIRRTDVSYPNNPHGLYIENYSEDKTIELTENE